MRGETAAEGSTLFFGFLFAVGYQLHKKDIGVSSEPPSPSHLTSGWPAAGVQHFLSSVGSRTGRVAQVPTAFSFIAKGAGTRLFPGCHFLLL